MKILLIDVWSPSHIGMAALIDNSLKFIKESLPEAEILISACFANSVQKYTGLKTVPYLLYRYTPEEISNKLLRKAINFSLRYTEKLWRSIMKLSYKLSLIMGVKYNPLVFTFSPRRREVVKAFMKADIIINISGESINENNGFLDEYLFFYYFALRLKKKLIFFPQSIGPVYSPKLRSSLRWILDNCALVIPRDEPSYDFLKELGVVSAKKIQIISDVAVTQDYINRKEALTLLKENNISIDENSKVVGIAVSRWIDKREEENRFRFNYIEEIKKFIGYLTEDDYRVILFPANFPSYKGQTGPQIDSIICNKIFEEMKNHYLYCLSRQYNPCEYKGILSLLTVFISTRMHLTIFATMALTPTICIATQLKLRGYMKNVNQEDYVIDIKDANKDNLISSFNKILENGESVREDLEKQRDIIQKRASRIKELLKTTAIID